VGVGTPVAVGHFFAAHLVSPGVTGHEPLELGPLQIDRQSRRALVGGRSLELTTREFSLLLHLADRADKVVSRSELLSEVWTVQLDRESNVVEVHVSRLRDKLGDLDWMIETVRGRGYRLRTRAPGA